MAMPTTAQLDRNKIDQASSEIALTGSASQPAIVKEFELMAANQESAPKRFDPKTILVTEMANRDPAEFETDEFKIFQASIEMTGGNEVPGYVYPLPKPTDQGHTHALIYGNRRLIACLNTGQLFKAIVQAKPDARTQIARMTRENDDRSATSVWKRAHWVISNLKHFDSARQYHYQTGTSETLITKYSKIVTLPEEVIELCVSTLDIKLEAAYNLALFRAEFPDQFNENLEAVQREYEPRSLTFVKLAKLLSMRKQKFAKTTGDDVVFKDAKDQPFATLKVNRAKELRVVVTDITPAEMKRVTEMLQRLR